MTPKMIANKTVIKATKIIDSYKVETGGLFKIVILIIKPEVWYKNPIMINIKGIILNFELKFLNIINTIEAIKLRI